MEIKDFDSFVGKDVSTIDLDASRAKGLTIRVIKPNSKYSKDFRRDRVNIHVDDNGIVTRVRLG